MKNLFSFLNSRLLGGGGRNPSENNKLYREEELQSNKSNFDSLKTNKGGELYLDLNTIISSENHIGGGSKSFVNEDCATLCSKNGGARHLSLVTPCDVNAYSDNVGGGQTPTLQGRREAI